MNFLLSAFWSSSFAYVVEGPTLYVIRTLHPGYIKGSPLASRHEGPVDCFRFHFYIILQHLYRVGMCYQRPAALLLLPIYRFTEIRKA